MAVTKKPISLQSSALGLATVGTRDLCIYGISDCFGPPNAPDLKVPPGPGVFWIVTSHLIEMNAPVRNRRKGG